MTERRAFVTGAAGNIGAAVVAELEARGTVVVGADVEAAGSIVACDVTDDAQIRAAVSEARTRLGGLDVVVNVVGVSGRRWGDGPVDTCTDEAWERTMATNLRSVFWVCRAAIPHLGEGSSIVNVSSVLGSRGGAPGLFETHAYAASKGGMDALTRAMAASYAPRGIRVNAVAPALVDTRMSARAQADETVMAHVDRRMPLTGILTPEQVAGAVAFLASDASSGITGVVVPVDGGWTAT